MPRNYSIHTGITRLLHRCITPLWSRRVAWPSGWLLPGRALCFCACRHSPVWCRLIGLYTHTYIYIRITSLTTTTIISTAIAFRGVVSTILPRDCCIFSHNEQDSIYFVFSISRLAQVVLHCIKARCETISVPALSASMKEFNLIQDFVGARELVELIKMYCSNNAE